MRTSRKIIASTAIAAAAAGIFLAAPAQADDYSNDVTAKVTDGRVYVQRGETYTYDVILTNHASQAKTVTVNDVLPSKLAFVSSDDFVVGTDGALTTEVQIAAGASETVSLTVQASTTLIGNVTNFVTVDSHSGLAPWRAWDGNVILR
ncbi:hypothetical protein ACIQTX_00440 [Microbacterium sp. NPDC090281]|uniref:hypothetical protein n=1 Tax=Microbacterium sp. NPDC090281 TaxID=3364208 RepID=UPI0038175B76